MIVSIRFPENGHMAAYQKEGDENGAKKLEVLNLDNGKKRESHLSGFRIFEASWAL